MTTTRAKFVCVARTEHAWSDRARTYRFEARYDTSIPEDRRFATATPTGHLEVLVDAPGVQYEVGGSYYLDITKAEEDPE